MSHLLNPQRFGHGLGGVVNALLDDVASLGVSTGDDEAFAQWVLNAHRAGDSWFVLRSDVASEIGFRLGMESEGEALHVWWGDGTTELLNPPVYGSAGGGDDSYFHTYATSDPHAVVMIGNLSFIRSQFSEGRSTFETKPGLLPQSLVYLVLASQTTLSGPVIDLPRDLTTLALNGPGNISGDTADLPVGLTFLSVSGVSALGGSFADLPRTLEVLALGGNTTVSGTVSELPENLIRLTVGGSSELTGAAIDLPRSLTVLSVSGGSNLSGSAADLPASLTELILLGFSTLTGAAIDLPRDLIILRMGASTDLTGNLADLPSALEHLDVSGSTSITGDVVTMPSTVNYLRLSGENTISGNVADLPRGITFMIVSGQNTLTGNVSGLPPTLDDDVYISGNNTLSGVVADLPSGIQGQLLITGESALGGDIGDTPVGVTDLSLGGNATVSGDLGSLPSGLLYLYLVTTGALTMTGTSISPGLSSIYIYRGLSTTSDVDNLLQAVWNSRDAPKPRLARSINLASLTTNPAPTDQTVADLLRAYRSPNNDPDMPLWNVQVNEAPPEPVVTEVTYLGSSSSDLSYSNRTVHDHTHTFVSTEYVEGMALLVFFMGDNNDRTVTHDAKLTEIAETVSGFVNKVWAGWRPITEAEFNAGSMAFSFTTSGSEVFQFVVFELGNVDDANPIDSFKIDESTTARTTIGPESFANVVEGALIAIGAGMDTAATESLAMTTANGFTSVASAVSEGSGDAAYNAAYKVEATGGTIDGPVFTGSSAEQLASIGVVVNPGTSGGLPPSGGGGETITAFTDLEVAYGEAATGVNSPLPSHEVGDLFLAAVMHRSTLTPPSGWTLVQSQDDGGDTTANQVLSVYSRVAQAGDGDNNVVWTQASLERIALGYVVCRSTTGAMVIESSYKSGSVAVGQEYDHPLPVATVTVPGSRVVAFSSCVYSTSSVRLYSVPAAWTQHGAASEANNRLAMGSVLVETPGTVSEAFYHNGFEQHSGSEIVLVVAPAEGGGGEPSDELFISWEAEEML